MSDILDALLANLRDPQKSAVLHRGSPLLIVAGPGSGKTEVLSRRVAHLILSGDVKPENMLVTTFTVKAALELKDRIQKHVPDINVELMQVSTIHSFCSELLHCYSRGPGASEYRILDAESQLLYVFANRKDLGLNEIVKGLPQHFYPSVVRAFNLATEELVKPNKLLSWCENGANCCGPDEKSLWNERSVVANAYRLYLDMLNQDGLVDFALLQSKALELLEDNEVLLKVREEYQEILVDEYQDTNAAQDRILSLIAGDGDHLTVVGDDDQSIYRFRGATVKNINTFCDRFPSARKITLEHNFRSRLPIVEDSTQVIVNNPAREEKNQIAVRGPGSDVLLIYEHTANEEALAEMRLIKKLHESGRIARYGDAAILLRSVKNAAGPYVDALDLAGIPYNITGDASLFQRSEASDLFNLLIFLGSTKAWSDQHLRNALVGLGAGTRQALQSYTGDLMDVPTDEGLRSIGIRDGADRMKVLALLNLKRQVQAKEHGSLLEVFYRLLSITGCVHRFEHEADRAALLNLGLLSQIFSSWDEFGKTRRIYPFNEYLKLLKDGGMEPSRLPLEDAIQIMTIHQAKGLEFPVVVLGSAMNGRLPTCRHKDPYEIPPDLKASGAPEVADPHTVDERKLYYVASTRARDLLIVGTANVVNKRGGGPSPFVYEMFGDDLTKAADISRARIIDVESRKGGLSGPKTRHSFSQLAYFLQCPVRYKLAVVYGLEMPWQDPIGYGANVHRALEEIHRRAALGNIPSEMDVSAIVSETWVSSHRTKTELENQFKKAAENQLKRYLKYHAHELPKTLQAETSFSFVMSDQVMLGKIDLLRQEGNGVEVVDFKTANSKPLEEEGIDLQLDLYALGVEESLGHKVAKTMVHFLGDGKVTSRAWSGEERDRSASRLADVLEHISREEFHPNRNYCERCDEFREICPYLSEHDFGRR